MQFALPEHVSPPLQLPQLVGTPQLSVTVPHFPPHVVDTTSRVQQLVPLQTWPAVQHVDRGTLILKS